MDTRSLIWGMPVKSKETSDAGLVGKMWSAVPTPVKVGVATGLTAILVACGSFNQPPPEPSPIVYNTPTPQPTATPEPTPEPSYIPNSPEEVRVYLTQAMNLGESYYKTEAETGVKRSEDLELALRILYDVAVGITRHNADNPDMLFMKSITCSERHGNLTEERLSEYQENKIKNSEKFQAIYVNEINRINKLYISIQSCITRFWHDYND